MGVDGREGVDEPAIENLQLNSFDSDLDGVGGMMTLCGLSLELPLEPALLILRVSSG